MLFENSGTITSISNPRARMCYATSLYASMQHNRVSRLPNIHKTGDKGITVFYGSGYLSIL